MYFQQSKRERLFFGGTFLCSIQIFSMLTRIQDSLLIFLRLQLKIEPKTKKKCHSSMAMQMIMNFMLSLVDICSIFIVLLTKNGIGIKKE